MSEVNAMFVLLETLVAVVEEKNITRAADKLHTTQPSVTRRIQQLEEEYRISLFDRQGKRLIVNKAGRKLYNEAKIILNRHSMVQHELLQFENPEQGQLHIGAGLTVSQFVLPSFLQMYQKKYPNIDFQLTSASSYFVQEKLVNYELDIGLITSEMDHPLIERIPLQTNEMILIAPADHPISHEPVKLHDLAKESFITFQKGAGFRDFIDKLWQKQDLSMQIKMETDSLEVIVKMVEHGIGLAFVPRIAAQPSLQNKKVKNILIKDLSIPHRTLSLIYRKDSYVPANVEVFIKEIISYCK